MKKEARANVKLIRQANQYSCVGASICMALAAHGIDVPQATVDKILKPAPGQGANWEQALACLQHFGMRGTLVIPSTIKQVKAWTDAGTPVIIGWNPNGRDWSHASVVFDVDDDGNVSVADPNLTNPEETSIIVPKDDFYKKWYEPYNGYLVRRAALAVEREITTDGRQTMASVKKAFRIAPLAALKVGELVTLVNSKTKEKISGRVVSTTWGDFTIQAKGKQPRVISVDEPWDVTERVTKQTDNPPLAYRASLKKRPSAKLARHEKGKKMTHEEVTSYMSEEQKQKWLDSHAKHKDKFKKKINRKDGGLGMKFTRTASGEQAITGKHIRIKVTSKMYAPLKIEELPSKPLKKRLRVATVYNNVHGSVSGYDPMDIIEEANLSSRMTFDQAVSALETRFRRLADSFAAGKSRAGIDLRHYDIEQIAKSVQIEEVFWLDIEPVDYKPLTIKGKDFTCYSEWNEFSIRGFREEEMSDHYMQAGDDPYYSYWESSSPTSARKLFKLVKADPTVVSSKTEREFKAWLDLNKIGVKYRASYR